jgi:hypothetical protein
MKFQNDKGLKLIKKSKSLSPDEIRTLVKNATPEARWRRHLVWMKSNQKHLDESVFNKLDEVRELLDDTPQNSRLILALLKVLDEFKARFDLQPLAAKGESFEGGRKKGSVGQIRQFIRDQFKKSQILTNDQLWGAISVSPPKGWRAIETKPLGKNMGKHSGKYLEGPHNKNGTIQNTDYESFCNAAAKERKLLKE